MIERYKYNMITVSNVSLQFGGDTLFKNVDLQFNPGNCYGASAQTVPENPRF